MEAQILQEMLLLVLIWEDHGDRDGSSRCERCSSEKDPCCYGTSEVSDRIDGQTSVIRAKALRPAPTLLGPSVVSHSCLF